MHSQAKEISGKGGGGALFVVILQHCLLMPMGNSRFSGKPSNGEQSHAVPEDEDGLPALPP